MQQRIKNLDGLRGLAILMVVGYHAFSHFWPQLNNSPLYADFFLFKYGYLGVELFFLISGYVIYMSLERSNTLGGFAYRRWLRLFPAMLLATIFFTLTWPILTPDRPATTPTFLNALPGLLFIENDWISAILGQKIGKLDGVFWTLFVEVKFYAIFSLLYFATKRYAIYALASLFLFAFALKTLTFAHISLPGMQAMTFISDALSFKHFGWFAAGAFLHTHIKYNSKRMLGAALALALSSCLTLGASNHKDVMLGGLIISAIFFTSMLIPAMAKLLANRFLVFYGFVSYPLYLIHDSTTVAIGLKFNKVWPGSTVIGLMCGVVLMTALAWIIAKYIEPALKRSISNLLTPRLEKLTGRKVA